MTTEEYGFAEAEALRNLQRIRSLGVSGDNIAFVMSNDVFLSALRKTDHICGAVDYEENGTMAGVRTVYHRYDIFIINEQSELAFQPAVKGFQIDCFDYDQLSLGDIVLHETVGEEPHIFSKLSNEFSEFADTGLTVRRPYEPVSNSRAALKIWRHVDPVQDWLPRWEPYESLSQQFSWEMDRAFDEAYNIVQKYVSTLKNKKRTPCKDDWDERLTKEDTRELDEFLDSLRKGKDH